MRRIITYFELLEQSFGVMTHGMEAEQFLKLRKALMPASGFQSAQYRLIELGCTDVIQLVEPDYRASMRDRSLEEQLQHIYWKRGATDAQTGAKTLTLRQFESKYADLFQRYARQQQDVNVRRRYPQWLAHHPEQEQPVHQQLKELDLLVNVRWPRAHLGAASRYLGGANRQKATGGTNWPQYLPPQRQHRIFFPELWTDRQQERWGLFTRPEDDAPAP